MSSAAALAALPWTLLVLSTCTGAWAGHVFYAPGHQYRYTYEGQTRIKDVGTFTANAEALIVPLSPVRSSSSSSSSSRQHCKMELQRYTLVVNNGGAEDQQLNVEDLDLGKWVSFHVSADGEIERVFHEASENPLILALKKVILSSLSSRLVVSEQALANQTRWGYQAQETGSEGDHTSVYKAEPDGSTIVFTKTKSSKLMSNAKEENNKVVHFRPAAHVPHKVAITEGFSSPDQIADGYVPNEPRTAAALHEGNNNLDLPAMSGDASVTLTLAGIEVREDFIQQASNMPPDLRNSTLEVGQVPPPELSLKDAAVQEALTGNISCIHKHDQESLQHHTPCFQALVRTLQRLPYADLVTFFRDNVRAGGSQQQQQQPRGVRQIVVDAYGAAATNATWTVLAELLLLDDSAAVSVLSDAAVSVLSDAAESEIDREEESEIDREEESTRMKNESIEVRTSRLDEALWLNISAELTLRSLVHFVGTEKRPPKIVLDTLEKKALKQQFRFPDPLLSAQVNERALLVLGSLAQSMLAYDPAWSHSIMRQVESDVGHHDPYNHRLVREASTPQQLARHVNRRALRLLSMGNARLPSSLPYLRSYLNDTAAHVLLRCAAVEAIGNFPHPEVAAQLLELALTDPEENVKLVSMHKYRRHTHGGDIAGMMAAEKRYGNVTDVGHVRMKRGIVDVLKRIWKGFYWKLESPTMDWEKAMGGSKLGASFGLFIKNFIEIDIKPLSGRLEANIYDSAFATIHVGILGFDVDVVKAELCFKGDIGYDLNILAEYGFQDVKKFAELYDTVVKGVYEKIKKVINNFKEVMSSFRDFSPRDIFQELVDSIQDMPDKILHLKQTARRVLEVLTDYADMPPVVAKITKVVKRVTQLFKDVKNDVMRFYQSVVDAVTVTIPWAWKEIVTAFNAIKEAIKVILKNPKGSIQAIGQSIARISLAVTSVIDAKNKVVDANIFAKENRPYWFDLPEVLTEIWDDVLDATQAVKDTVTVLTDALKEDEKAKEYTGISLRDMKQGALLEIIAVVEQELAEPFKHIRRLLDPFINAYKLFKETVDTIKESWGLMVNGYKEARSQLDLIFGPKFHKTFPKKYLESPRCGDGFWESTGRGHYDHPGVDAQGDDMEIGEEVVTPFAGELYVNSTRQVSVRVDGLQQVMLILDNVAALDKFTELAGQTVAAGAVIGTLLEPEYCGDPHLHVALLKLTDGGYIDPSRYMERRRMPEPKWVQHCDHYLLTFLGRSIQMGSITGGPTVSDESPEQQEWLEGEQELPEIVDGPLISRRRKRDLSDTADFLLDKLSNFTQSLGLNVTHFKELFSIKISDVKVHQVLDVLDTIGLGSIKTSIIGILKKIEDIANHEECVRPDSLDDDQLKVALVMRGKNAVGSSETLLKRYLETEPRCMGIQPRLSRSLYCRFDPACLSMSCCADLKFFIYRHALSAFMAYDPCALTVTIGLGDKSLVIDLTNGSFPLEESEPVVAEVQLLNLAQLVAYYRISRDGDGYKLHIGVSWCSVEKEICDDLLVLVDDASLPAPATACQPGTQLSRINTTVSGAPTVDKMLNMTITDLWKLVDNMAGIDQATLKNLTDDLRQAFEKWMLKRIDDVLLKIFGKEFDLFDMCAKGFELEFGPTKVAIVPTQTIYFALGPIPCYFSFGIDGAYGATFHCTLCIMSMKAEAHIMPQVGSSAFGELGVSLWCFKAGLRLTAYILTTSFPTKAEVYFSKFPLDVRSRMDMVLIPLRIELHARLVFEMDLGWFGKIHKVLINKRLWFYQTRAINKNIFKVGDIEPDDTPPDFSFYSKATYKNDTDSSGRRRKRRRRATGVETTTRCRVEQLPNRDHTEPGYNIELDVNDDRSQVTMTYCVGTYPGACDVVRDESLGGTSTIVLRNLVSGHKLWFSVTARNSAGAGRTATCELPTYDMTLPAGRVTEGFSRSSHPSVIQASVFAVDDSVIIEEKVSAGYSRGWHGWQVVDWMDIATSKVTTAVDTGHDPLGLRLLEKYTPPKRGRLVHTAFKLATYSTPQACARDCLSFPPTRCQSFNYDYAANAGDCELLEAVEGHGLEIHQNGAYSHFERIGIGRVATVQYDDLSLVHGTLVYVNVYLKNVLGYVQILTSGQAVEINLTPPNPGPIANASMDVLNTEPCSSFTPKHLQWRCQVQTPLHNYRYIVDGPGSRTVFNGNSALEDKLYTRANRMIAANWDGFHDNVTGILVYTWSVGTDHCEADVHPHNDPHSHLKDETEWTHSAVAHPLDLADGPYHVSVRALSNIDYGGPMALTVCHSTAYVVDTTAPVIHETRDVTYNETSFLITAVVNATDYEGSGIRRVEFGLGLSRRDTHLLPYVDVEELDPVEHVQRIRDGVATWVKIRVTDHVDLRASGHSRKPIVVDTTPPIVGEVYDGPHSRKDWTFQASVTELCASWDGFYDAESGIIVYQAGVGSSVDGVDDVAPLTNLSHETTGHCFTELSLLHAHTYYAVVRAWNGGHIEKNATAVSDGVTVDTTPPESGWVRDGTTSDLQYTSEAATVAMHKAGFADPESGEKLAQWNIFRKHAGPDTVETLLHTEDVTGGVDSKELQHFHLRHGDRVTAQVNVTNGARLSTLAASDGFTVDLTDPEMRHLHDGTDPAADQLYTARVDQLSANWDFYDDESGIENYCITAYRLQGSAQRQIFPVDQQQACLELTAADRTWTAAGIADLTPGGRYVVQVGAVNGAGLTSVRTTSGVVVDVTAPQMLYVHAGVQPGESEEVIEGVVLHNNPAGVLASWAGLDTESGVTGYVVAVGTSPGADDIRDWQDMGVAESGFLDGLTLELADDGGTGLPLLYYITVRATNGAGQQSQLRSSSPIKMVPGDQSGTVTDGPDGPDPTTGDVDYQLSTHGLTLTFAGFESALHGIARHEVGVGSRPRFDDVMAYTADGIISHDVDGIGSHGQAQLLLALAPGERYHVSVRAVTGAGRALDAASDGVVVDTSAPAAERLHAGRRAVVVPGARIQNGGVVYQRDPDAIPAAWSVQDDESPVTELGVTVGTVPGASDVLEVIVDPSVLSLDTQVHPAAAGVANILALTATNMVGLENRTMADTVILDQTPPELGELHCPSYISGGSGVTCRWTEFLEAESTIDHFLFGLGHAPGDTGLMDFVYLDPDQLKFTAQDLDDVVAQQDVLYATLLAINKVGLRTQATSAPIVVDDTPPVGGWVIELPDIDSPELQVLCSNGQEYCEEQDAVCQRSVSQIITAWEAFTDPETDIVRYEVGVGSLPGGTQLSDFRAVPNSPAQRHLVISGLDLFMTRDVYVTVKGYNAAGRYATATSSGVAVSRVSAGLPPPGVSWVYDGLKEDDLEFLEQNEQLSAHWDFSGGDPCPVLAYRMAVHRVDGMVAVPAQDVPQGQTSGEVDELDLQDGETYFFVVTATNALGYTYSLYSDGVTVMLEPLLPGNVRDGIIDGVDLNFQPSVTTLSANWDGFGYDRNMESNGDVVDDPSVDAEIGRHQIVARYLVAVGTDRRFAATRNNVVPFTDVGLRTRFMFRDLTSLVAKTATYYVTVRAVSLSTATAETTSNGVKVGYGGHVIALGEVDVPRWSAFLSSLTITWGDFLFLVPVKYYEVGITAANTTQPLADDCGGLKVEADGEIVNSALALELFSVLPLVNTGLDTAIELSDLDLQDGGQYQVVVMATDESGTCSLATALTAVDVTPPTEGTLCVGPEFDMEVLYASEPDSLHVSWVGYRDDDSGILRQEITLHEGICSSAGQLDQYAEVKVTEVMPAHTVVFDYLGLQLQEDVAYFVTLRVVNKAGLDVESRSRPVLLDLRDPQAGEVHDGKSFVTDIKYQSNVTSLSGSILYMPSEVGPPCPYTTYPLSSGHEDWQPLVHGSMQALPDHVIRTLDFSAGQVSYSSSDGLTIQTERSISAEKVKSGCVSSTTQLLGTGSYKFEMKTDGSAMTIGSVTFWDGPQGLPAGLNLPDLFEDSTQTMTDPYGDLGDGVESLPAPVLDDTYVESFEDDFKHSTGFGFLLAPGMTHASVTSDWLVLLSIRDTRPRLSYLDLGLGFTTDWHTYELHTLFEDDSTDIILDMSSLSVEVDGKLRCFLSAAPYLHGDVQVLMMAHTYRGYVPPLNDIFNPPASTVHFRELRFPPSVSTACRYGRPFRGGDHAVLEFLAGVGTSPDTPDVLNFTKVLSPCIPCQEPCGIDSALCDAACPPAEDVREFSFTLEGLSLDPLFQDDAVASGGGGGVGSVIEDDHNVTISALPAPYYLIVKAVTGSGRSATSADNGIYVDPSAPTIGSILHIDAAWSQDEPSDYQGNDHTIAALMQVDDPESGVTGCEWAIGTTPGGTEIQPFVVSEFDDFVMNSDLTGRLENRKTYYITMSCTNEAGLVGTKISDGVTVLLEEPDVSGATSDFPGSEPLGEEAARTDRQDEVSIEWGEPGDPTVDAVYVGLGSNESAADVFPERQVGYNSSGRLTLSGDSGLTLDEDDPNAARANLSDARDRRVKRQVPGAGAHSQLFLEPGRMLYAHIKACSKAHKCAQIPVKPLLIARADDTVATRNAADQFELTLDQNIQVRSKQGQSAACNLVGGTLNEDDLNADYHSDASNDFKPSIVNLATTTDRTDRNLRDRITSTSDVNFFLSSTCQLSGALEVTLPFDAAGLAGGDPKLLTWCPESEQWVDASRSCGDVPLYSINWQAETLTVQVCNLASLCGGDSGATARKKRAVDGASGQASFSLAAADPVFANTAPVVTSPSTVDMFEDDGFRRIRLTAVDADGDDLVFRLNTSGGSMGNVTLTADNWLIYRPCENCEGPVSISFSVIEKRTDGEEALVSNSFVTITVNGVNDNPRVLVVKNGLNVASSNRAGFSLEENSAHNENYEDLRVILMAYDPDSNDNLTVEFEAPTHGNLTYHSQIRRVTFVDSACVSTAGNVDWNRIAREVIANAADSFSLPRPCGVDAEAFEPDVSWVLTAVTYTPDPGYFGQDAFKVISLDQTSAPSELTTIELYVLNNPCHNGAKCEGPDYDPDCSATYRTNGFAEYTCRCPPGYAGYDCSEDADDCADALCPANMTCVDAFDNFTCVCEPGAGCAEVVVDEVTELETFLAGWHYGVIAAGLAVPMIAVAVLLIYCCKKSMKENDEPKRRLWPGSGSSSDHSYDGSRLAIFRNRFTGSQPYAYQDPLSPRRTHEPHGQRVTRTAHDMFLPGAAAPGRRHGGGGGAVEEYSRDSGRTSSRPESRERAAFRVRTPRNQVRPEDDEWELDEMDLDVLRALDIPPPPPPPPTPARFLMHAGDEARYVRRERSMSPVFREQALTREHTLSPDRALTRESGLTPRVEELYSRPDKRLPRHTADEPNSSWTRDCGDREMVIPQDRPKHLPRVKPAWWKQQKVSRVSPAPDYPGAEDDAPGYQPRAPHY